MNFPSAGPLAGQEDFMNFHTLRRSAAAALSLFPAVAVSPAFAQAGAQAPESGAGLFWIIIVLLVFGAAAAWFLRRR
jgi:hypothetical protein